MSFTVNKTQAGITNYGKLFSSVDSDATIVTTLESMSVDGSSTFEFIFAGSGPLSSAENDALDNLLTTFTNDVDEDVIISGSDFTQRYTYLGKPSSDSTWETITVTGAPPDSIIYITIETVNDQRAGVRAVGSTVDRNFRVYATSLTLPVKTNSDGQIQVWGNSATNTLIYYTGVVI